METAAKYATRPSEAPTSQALLTAEIRKKIVKELQTHYNQFKVNC